MPMVAVSRSGGHLMVGLMCCVSVDIEEIDSVEIRRIRLRGQAVECMEENTSEEITSQKTAVAQK